ncbi:DUF4269 domain-containing protein [Sulfidibacter corallicola]|uniref:DUF4269 domain-containing protein n=1 Tax=Sulfidibacter corallicola TaxID=2818388 RepID=A0A8A4TUN7_SULCO|nr:DUF4269 domain-containing protein [Sulfidibacter corallicola]QTD52742.1 DUF4269 domain-containing protein [Sulfidibacter corallicola]
MNRDWRDITHLMSGTDRQRAVYQVIRDLDVFYRLKHYSPLLVGTYPIDLDIEDSDIDIICHAENLIEFDREITAAYARYQGFLSAPKIDGDLPSLTVDFTYKGMQVQIFAQQIPVEHQIAFRHMVIEDRLLHLAGFDARKAIRALKRRGLKTEPAFARYLEMEGDPYRELLALCRLSDEELLDRLPILRNPKTSYPDDKPVSTMDWDDFLE